MKIELKIYFSFFFFFDKECIELRHDQKYENNANKDPLSGKINKLLQNKYLSRLLEYRIPLKKTQHSIPTPFT